MAVYSRRWCSEVVGKTADWNSLPKILGFLPLAQQIDHLSFTKFHV